MQARVQKTEILFKACKRVALVYSRVQWERSMKAINRRDHTGGDHSGGE